LSAGTDMNWTVGQGDVSAAGDTTATAGRHALIDIGTGNVTMTGTTALAATAGDLSITIGNGDLGLAGVTVLSAGRDMTWTIGLGDVSASGDTAATAGRHALIDIGTGNLTMTGTTALTATAGNQGITIGTGHLSLAGVTALSAGTDMSWTIGQGHVSASGDTTARAGRHAQIDIGTGNLTLTGTTALSATAGNQGISIGAGNLSLAGVTTLSAGTDMAWTLGQGNLSATGTTTATAGRDAAIGIGTGHFTLTGTTAFTATTGDLGITLGTGNLTVSGVTQLTAGHDLGMAIGRGTLSTSGRTTATAAHDLTVGIDVGDLLLRDTTEFRAGHDLVVRVGTGQVGLRDDTLLAAGQHLGMAVGSGDIFLGERATLRSDHTLGIGITGQGGLVMADAQTLIEAGDSVDIRTIGTIRLDLVRAGDSVSLRSAQGSILDNTAAETDLVVTRRLDLFAATGIGLPWVDNLNVDVQEINAFNTTRGGINLQNRGGFTVGELGISNLSRGDIALAAGGAIEQAGLLYQRAPGGANTVSNLPGWRIYAVSYLTETDLEEQWGNLTPQLTSIVTAQPAVVDLAALMRGTAPIGSSGRDDSALQRMLAADGGWIDSEDWLQRRIRMSDRALLAGPGQILASLGLAEAQAGWYAGMPAGLTPAGLPDEEDDEQPLPPGTEPVAGNDGNWQANQPMNLALNAMLPGSMSQGNRNQADDPDAPLIAPATTPGARQVASHKEADPPRRG
jgi:hypothetical protein